VLVAKFEDTGNPAFTVNKRKFKEAQAVLASIAIKASTV